MRNIFGRCLVYCGKFGERLGEGLLGVREKDWDGYNDGMGWARHYEGEYDHRVRIHV